MAPPRKTPRLEDLDPDALAKRIEGLVIAHLRRFSLTPDAAAAAAREFEVGRRVRLLYRWARYGEGSATEAAASLVRLEFALFGRGVDESPPELVYEIDTEIGLLFAASRGRLLLAKKQSIPVVLLAAVAGANRQRIRQLLDAGELRRETRPQAFGRQMDAPVLCSDARKMLAIRGVAGFEG